MLTACLLGVSISASRCRLRDLGAPRSHRGEANGLIFSDASFQNQVLDLQLTQLAGSHFGLEFGVYWAA